MKDLKDIQIYVATEEHLKYVDEVNDAIDIASKEHRHHFLIAPTSLPNSIDITS